MIRLRSIVSYGATSKKGVLKMKTDIAAHGVVDFPYWRSLSKMQRLTAGLYFIQKNDWGICLQAIRGDAATMDVLQGKIENYIRGDARPILSRNEVNGIMGRPLSFLFKPTMIMHYYQMKPSTLVELRRRVAKITADHFPERSAALLGSVLFKSAVA